jgi:uncharacterized protein (TIGR02217 family)
MTFLETPRLDPRITDGARSTTKWSRDKSYSIGGKLRQKFNWANAKHVLDVAYRPRQSADYFELVDLFNVVMANGLEGFRAKNWGDYLLTQTNSTLTFIDGTDFQIQRVHAFGAYEWLRNITKPIDPVIIYRNGIVAADAVVDYTTGIVALSSHIGGDTYTAEGEFDIPVTFVGDEWIGNFRGTSTDLWISPDPVLLEEIRLTPAA